MNRNGLKITKSESVKWHGVVRVTLRNVVTGVERTHEYHNLFVTSGKAAIARRLIGDTDKDPNTGKITYCAVGRGTTAPAATNVKLQTESARKSVSSVTRVADNVCRIRGFFSTTEGGDDGGGPGNVHLYETGLFGEDASGTADSGTLFNRVNIDVDKTDADTLTIEFLITIS
jgi:hypothetical protein